MKHGRSCDIEIWWPSVENVAFGLRHRATFSTSGSSYFNVHSLPCIICIMMMIISLQPINAKCIQSWRWRSWPMNASCNWVDLCCKQAFKHTSVPPVMTCWTDKVHVYAVVGAAYCFAINIPCGADSGHSPDMAADCIGWRTSTLPFTVTGHFRFVGA